MNAPQREPMTYYKGHMLPRSEVARLRAEEAAQMAGPAVVTESPPPRPPGPTPATRTPGPAPMFSSNTGDWYTPPEIVEAVRDLFDGRIDLDPCSNSHEAPNVPALVHFTREDDGLSREWFGRVYLNPPYGKGIGPWIEKVREEYEAGRVTAAVVLVKAATDTRWFRVLSERYPRCEVAGRLRFSGCKNPAPFPSVLFYLGDEVQRFADVFGRFGVLVAPLPAARKAEEVRA